jgi:formylglycine-generating enzyme required for sulfatase activity
VSEWTYDWFKAAYPTDNPSVDPSGPPSGLYRVIRSSCWAHFESNLRSARRLINKPNARSSHLGFRLALVKVETGLFGSKEKKAHLPNSVNSEAGIFGPTHKVESADNLEMIWVKPGTFMMGSPPNEKGRHKDETQHRVTLTKGFYLGRYEVTQAQWNRVMGSNPSKFKGAGRPVEQVSWNGVRSFCRKLSEMERQAGRLPPGMAYQLPTEAQWEYACRAGTTTAFSWGNDIDKSKGNYNWHRDYNTGNDFKQTRNVGQYAANPWGFHDMQGNVWEWCADWYGNYPGGAVLDPVGPKRGSNRVRRGGAWGYGWPALRSAERHYYSPSTRGNDFGFRISLL